MSELNKTKRILQLTKWLIESKSLGITKESILKEFLISEKTFYRDLKELDNTIPFFKSHYDKDQARLYGQLAFPLEQKRQLRGSFVSEDQINIFKNAGIDSRQFEGTYYFNFRNKTEVLLSKYEFEILLNSILNESLVTFLYKKKERLVFPLFFYYYSEYWYLFCFNVRKEMIVKFRVDLVDQVSVQLLKKINIDKALIRKEKKKAFEMIQKAQNIFVDLSYQESLLIQLRFLYPIEYLKKEFSNCRFLRYPKKEDLSVVDIEIAFSGFKEATIALNKWLGSYQILGPEAFRERYLEFVEEALSIL